MQVADKTWYAIQSNYVNAELIKVIALSHSTPKYRTDILAEDYGHAVLRFPVGHCKLNPIELAWGQVQGYTAHHNTGLKEFNMKNTKGLRIKRPQK
jgi:hypothetical protein